MHLNYSGWIPWSHLKRQRGQERAAQTILAARDATEQVREYPGQLSKGHAGERTAAEIFFQQDWSQPE